MTSTMTPSSTGRGHGSFIWVMIILLAVVFYFAVGVRAAKTWATPRHNTYFPETPASFNLEYRNVTFPSRDPEIQISGWWIPRAGSHKAIVMTHGRGENRTSEFYTH